MEYEGVQKLGEKAPQIAHSCMTVSVHIGTKSVLPVFSWLVPVPISVVPVPLCYCLIFQPWYHYQFWWYRYHFTKVSRILYIFGFHCMLASFIASNPLQIDLCLLNCVLHFLGTFTLTLESSLLHVIKNPKVRTKLATQGLGRVQGVTQYDLEV